MRFKGGRGWKLRRGLPLDPALELELLEALLCIFEEAEAGGFFDLVFRWIPREQLAEVDAYQAL